MTDGRDDVLDRCINQPPIFGQYDLVSEFWIHDDTGDDDHRAALAGRYLGFTQIGDGPRRGFGGAIRWAWSQLMVRSQARFVLHVEDDFLLGPDVDLYAMAAILDMCPDVQQVALRRQAWNDAERAAGGVVEQHPGDYREVTRRGYTWLEHRRFFTTNPSLYRMSLCNRDWPDGPHSEGHFGIQLFAENPANRCAFLGARNSAPMAEHIGHARVGTGY